MNFLKWFGYLALCAAFIWFVFYKPLNINSAVASTDANGDDLIETTNSDIGSTIEDTDDYVDNIDNTTEENPVESPVETIVENPVSNEGSINLNSKYLIVVGSFGNRSNADRMLQRVKDSGKEGIITNIRGLNRVVTASSDDRTDARGLRDHFTHIYKEQAFILEQ